MTKQSLRFAFVLSASAVLAPPVFAGEGELSLKGSATLELKGTDLTGTQSDKHKTGFFDQYDFRRGKGLGDPIEMGLSEFQLDLLGDAETPLLQLRFRSPSSNLGFAGSDLALNETFLNQRAEVLVRPKGVQLDLDYHRSRVDELRLFSHPSGATVKPNDIATVFTDETNPDDRFSIRRTGIGANLRLHPDALTTASSALGDIVSEIGLRANFEARNGKRQLRYMLSGGSDRLNGNNRVRWRSLTQDIDQSVHNVGGGLVFRPLGLFTLALDLDHERFREGTPTIFQNQVALSEPDIKRAGDAGLRTFGFIPDTNRTTATARINTRIGERGTVYGGLQLSRLSMEGETPLEAKAGLKTNTVQFYSGNLGANVAVASRVSANAHLRFEIRRNRIPRDTPFFHPGPLPTSHPNQFYAFLKRVRRIESGAELVFRARGLNQLAAGFKGLWIDRDIGYPIPEPGFDDGGAIPNSATFIRRETQTYTAYLRTSLRPLQGVQVSGEFGLQNSPKTGYPRDLEHGGYGRLRASYALPTARPVTVSVFANGIAGQNRKIRVLGTTPGNGQKKDFEQRNFTYGVTLTGSPWEHVTAFVSVFQDRDSQDFPLLRTDFRRYTASFTGLNFFLDDDLGYQSDLTSLILGGTSQVTENTELTLRYSFTRSNTRFQTNNLTSRILDGPSRILSDIHSVGLDLGHWVRPGLRVAAGYRFDTYRDRTPVTGTGVVVPFNPSTRQHTVTLALTLNSDFFKGAKTVQKP